MKRRIGALLLIGLMLMQLPCANAQENAKETQTNETVVQTDGLDEQVDRIFRETKTVGGAFLVAKQGEIVYERYYGMQHKSKNVPVTADSYFRCASVTKWVTGIGLLKLMEEGVLAADEDISTYLGYTVRNPRYAEMPITLRMLSSHTAGMNESGSYNKRSSLLSDMLDVSKKARANFKDVRPGSQYTYSNFGAGIVGAVMEAVTGQDVSSYMRSAVFEPLGIDAAYNVNQLADPDDICASYKKDGTLNVSPGYLLRQPFETGADPDTHYRTTVGSLFIRTRDLTRLGIALCGDGTVDGVRVLGAESLAMARQEQSSETTGITSDSPYSFFTIRSDTLLEGRRVYGHQGTSEGIVCNLYYEPQSETVFCVMTNGCNSTREDGIMRITRRLCTAAVAVYLSDGE